MKAKAISMTVMMGAVGVCMAADPLSLDVSRLFTGAVSYDVATPRVVHINNQGPSTTGVVRYESGGELVECPVDIPQGANKRIVIYPDSYLGQVDLVTRKGVVTAYDTPASYSDQGAREDMLLISDHSADLSFLRHGEEQPITKTNPDNAIPGMPKNGVATNDWSCSPDDAPDRPIGYASANVVVLGEGAERLSDASVRALKQYQLKGGILVFIGGASSPVTSDPRWKGFLPMSDLKPKVFPATVFETIGAMTPDGPVTLLQGKLDHAVNVKGDQSIFAAERIVGLGKSVLLTFNPFEAPMREYDYRSTLFLRLIHASDRLKATQVLSSTNGSYQTNYNRMSGFPAPSIASGITGLSSSYGSVAQDPFSVKLPAFDRVFGLLAIYFVAVVPLNFLVLKKMRRGELAWFTAPALSLAFAGVLFQSASALYSAQASTASQGILIAQAGIPDGVFSGGTAMFFPRGGRYDLGLQGVDDFSNSGFVYSRRQRLLNAVDDGQIRLPNFEARNLSFDELRYNQRVEAGDWITFQMGALRNTSEGRRMKVTVHNQGPYDVSDAQVLIGFRQAPVGDLKRGQTVIVDAIVPGKDDAKTNTAADYIGTIGRNNSVVLLGQLNQFKPGPQIGKEVKERHQITLAYYSGVQVGAK